MGMGACSETDVCSAVVENEWAQQLFRYIDVKVGHGERSRENMFETLIDIQWAMRQLLRFQLDEDIILHLIRRLEYVGGYLSWQISRPSLTKTMLHQETMLLRQAFAERLCQMFREGKLRQPQNFIRFDSEGVLEAIGQTGAASSGFVSADAVALLYDMTRKGIVTRETFLSRLMSEGPRCFMPLDSEVLIACGEAPLSVCRGPGEITDFAVRKLSISWWLDVNFPPDQLGDFPYIASRIPLFVRALLRGEEARLFLSAAGEMSHFRNEWYEQIVGLARHLECKIENIVYLPQNAGFAHDFSAFVLAGRATQGIPLVIPLNSHLLLPSLQQPAKIGNNPTKRFLCFNHWPHLHRTALFLNMWRDGMIPDSHVSFNHSMRRLPEHVHKVTPEELVPWLELPEDKIAKLMDEVEPKLPLRLDLNDQTAGPSALGAFIWQFDARLHEDAAFYIVTESEMGGSSSRRFTEKTVKGLAAMSPFIVFGNGGTLVTLREWGFETFSSVIDETYDNIDDPVARFHAAYAELRKLNALPMANLLEMRRTLFPVLEHNRQRLLSAGQAFVGILQKGFSARAAK
jgi:hypothetical protein